MKKTLFLIITAFGLLGCFKRPEAEYFITGHLYKDCAKVPLKNVELEIARVGGGFGGQKVESLAKTRTNADGSYTLRYTTYIGDDVSLRIPANDQAQLYSSIVLSNFKAENKESYTLYTEALTKIKVKLKCMRTFTNQDTLYINPTQPGAGYSYIRVINPQEGQIALTWNQVSLPYVGVNYGVGWADFSKSRQSVSGDIPDYQFRQVFFPTCEKSPLEYELKID